MLCTATCAGKWARSNTVKIVDGAVFVNYNGHNGFVCSGRHERDSSAFRLYNKCLKTSV